MMGLERGLNRVRCVLTPKRRAKNENIDPDEPNILSGKVCFILKLYMKILEKVFDLQVAVNFILLLKGLSNVSATCSGCPKHVLSKLRRALRQKGIMCRQKG